VGEKENSNVAEELLARIRQGAEPDDIAALFREDVAFEIPGDDGALPWIGRKRGRRAVADFIRDLRRLTEPIRFDVQEILASHDRAVIVGELATRIKATGKVIDSAMAIILTISEGQISRFQMLEDSFAVSQAARR
jgi:ketosteroid isomerase-like protein